MNQQDFIAKYGEEAQEVTKNYTTKSLGKNYHIKDAFIEFCDNAYDAKLDGTTLNFLIEVNDEAKTFTILDDGKGISSEKSLFKLGETDKVGQEKIGKYGIGVPGAVACIATKCRFNINASVEVIYESACNGKKFEKHILFTPKGEQYIGKATFSTCKPNEHFTKITFKNVQLNQIPEVIEGLELTFEEPIRKGNINIIVNGRQLGKTLPQTFLGDEIEERIKVGKFTVYVKWRISSSNSSDEREFEKSGIRVYDKKTGRLLAMNTKYWDWFAGKNAQQTICGLRIGIYIESSIECYDKFGVMPTKNGITYKKYHNDLDFKELSERLKEIYKKAASTNSSHSDDNIITIGTRNFQPTSLKLEKPFQEIAENTFIFKKKLSTIEIATLINDYISLKKKVSKK